MSHSLWTFLEFASLILCNKTKYILRNNQIRPRNIYVIEIYLSRQLKSAGYISHAVVCNHIANVYAGVSIIAKIVC